MSLDDSGALPTPQAATGQDLVISAGMKIAKQWGELPPKHLEAALNEPFSVTCRDAS